MLQQTQTGTVSEKFLKFIKLFPNFKALSEAPLEKVLKAWKGLGYNRRAIALKSIAKKIVEEYDGKLPESVETLKKFPQIGHNTASSIVTFAFNKPTLSPFKGSNREIRGKVLKMLVQYSALSESSIIKRLEFKASRIRDVLNQLVKEGFIKKVGNNYYIV